MIRIMLAATDILISCLGCCLLVLVHQVEVYVVDHSLLLIHIMRPRSLNGSKPTTANFVVVLVCVHTVAVLDGVHLLLSYSLLLS